MIELIISLSLVLNFDLYFYKSSFQKVNYDRNNCTSLMDALLKQRDTDVATGTEHPLEDRNILGIGMDFYIAGKLCVRKLS